MSVTPGQVKWVTPTYSANLNFAVHTVVVALNNGDLWGAWECLNTLYDLCHPEVIEAIQEDFDKVRSALRQVVHGNSLNVILANVRKRELIMHILRNNNRMLFRKLLSELFKKGYLEKQPVSPKRPSEQRLSWQS